MIARLLLLGAILTLGGCSSSPAESSATPPATKTAQTSAAPAPSDYERLRSALTQIGPATDTIATAYELAQKLRSRATEDQKDGLAEVIDYLDDAGQVLSKFAIDPPTQQAFDSDRRGYDERAKKTLEAAEDATESLANAAGIAEGLTQDAKSVVDQWQELEDGVNAAHEDVNEIVQSLKGTASGRS